MAELTISEVENNKRIAKNTALLYFRLILTMCVALYTSRVIFAILGEVDYGIYNVVGGVVVMFTFLNGALSASTSRFITIELGKKDYVQLQKIFSITLVNHFLIALVILILAETVGLWFVMNKLVIPPNRMVAALFIYQFSIFSCIVTLIETPYNAVIIAHEKMNVYAWVSIVDAILKLTIVYVLALFSIDHLKLYSILTFSVISVVFLFYYFYVKNRFVYCRFKYQTDKKLYKELICYSVWDLFGNISSLAQGQGLNILLNIFFGPSVNAANGIARQVQSAVGQFTTSITTAVRPQIIKYYAVGERNKMIDLVFNSSKMSFYLVLFLFIPIILETDYILGIWIGNVPRYTVIFTRIILVIILINSFRNPLISAMHATGKIKYPNIICGSILIATLPVSYLFLKQGYNPSCVFFVSMIATFITMCIEQIIIKRSVGHSILKFINEVVIISLIVAVLSFILPYIIFLHLPSSFFRLVIVFLTSTMSVSLMSYCIGINKNTRNIINNKIRQLINKK